MLFGILDMARDKNGRMAQALAKHSDNAVCLFSGKLDEGVRRRAPYLVPLPAESAFARFWLETGWDDDWGVLLRSDRPQEDVRRHLRQFLRAQMPDGRIVLFRFYDPRILPTYLRSCSAAELAAWFAAIDLFRVHLDNARGYGDFSFDGVRLVER
jgi:hypothetical protein